MNIAALAILGPFVAAAAILAARRGAAALALLGAGVATLAALVTLARVAAGARFATTLPGLPGLPLRLVVSPAAAAFSATVAVVSLLVLVYAVGYMRGERDQPRFYAGMSLFVAAMQGFVLAGDWILLIVCWELIALASYLLIGFWYERPAVGGAATRAFLTTRAADLGLYIGVLVLIARTGTSAIAETLGAGGGAATLAGLLLLVAAMGKAAQVPLQGWLQDAMLGPTPVSALLHSATLVAAGAILMIRAAPLLRGGALLVVGAVGGVTAVVAGLTALAHGDVKRMLAASTSSQLGFMLLAVGAGSPAAATLHLITQAAMKSALFQGAGYFQHAREATDFRGLAGVGRAHRRIFTGFAVAGLALAGMPPLAGFWSKDAIVAAAFGSPYAPFLAPLVLIGTLLTGAYVARALRLLWRGEGREEPVAGGVWMGAALAILALLAATLGVIAGPLGALLAAEVPESTAATVAALLVAVAGLAAGWFVPSARLLGPVRGPAARGFRIAGGVDALVVRPALALAALAARVDTLLLDGVYAVGRFGLRLAALTQRTDRDAIDAAIAALVRGTRETGARARRLQSGFVSRELVFAMAGGAALIALLILLR